MNDSFRGGSRADCCPRAAEDEELAPLFSSEADSELALVANALSHPVRVRIVRILLERRACACGEIVSELPLAQATVSQHLKILKEAGLVQGEIDGSRVCYCVNPRRLARLETLVGSLTETHMSDEREVVLR